MVNPSMQLELRVFIDKYRELMPPFVVSSLCAIMTMDEDDSKKEIEHLQRTVRDQSENISKLTVANAELEDKVTSIVFPQHDIALDVKLLPDEYDKMLLVHILRNPFGWAPSSIRTAMLASASLMEATLRYADADAKNLKG
jgi:hypothetical protein